MPLSLPLLSTTGALKLRLVGGVKSAVQSAVPFVILISSSGKSKNMVNAAKFCQQNNLKSLITFTGFEKKNYLSKNSDINFWINLKKYNIIENSHQFYLLMIVDLMKKFTKWLKINKNIKRNL